MSFQYEENGTHRTTANGNDDVADQEEDGVRVSDECTRYFIFGSIQQKKTQIAN
jgi:hypothetical protein